MPCYSPLKAFRSQDGSVMFKEPRNCTGQLTLPCGQCVGCRLERSRQWAVRCMHEASLYKHNCFITLTYSPENVPADGSLDKTHFQKFMKRFRKRFSGMEPVPLGDGSMSYPIRFYMAGEYGTEFGRPHYHACIFNYDFPDKVLFKKSPSGSLIYRSPSLEALWPFGFSSVGDVTFSSAAYVARYIMKKVTGNSADLHYETVNPVTGEVTWRQPEYNDMSRNPGIASRWFEKFSSDVYPHDRVIVKGKAVKPPRFYDLRLEKQDSVMFDAVKHERFLASLNSLDDNTPDRLVVKQRVKEAQISRLIRKLH